MDAMVGILLLLAMAAPQAGTPAYRQVLDNPRLSVEEVTFAPGDEEREHTHKADVLLVAITGGVIESVTPDGMVTRVGEKPGDVLFLPKGFTHRARSASSQTVVLRVIVLK